MTSWQNCAIGDLGRVVTGKTPPAARPEAFGKDFQFVTPTDMVGQRFMETTDRYLSAAGAELQRRLKVPKGSLMVSCIGWQLGKVAISTSDSFTNQQINTIIPDTAKVYPLFLYYHLRTRREELKRLASGGTRTPILNKSRFEELRVLVPPRHHQESIAQVLGAIDDLIENNRLRVEVLEKMTRAIYREWFVKFRYPGHRDVPLVNSTLGPIPVDWEAGRVDSLLFLQRGFDLPLRDREPGAIPVVGASGLQGSHIVSKAQGPGVTTGRSGTVGVVTYVPGEFWPLNTSLWVKEFRLATPRYAYFLLAELDLQRAASGAAVPSLDRKVVHGIPAVCPPPDLIEKWDSLVAPMFETIETLRRQSVRLTTARDLLLPKLVTGQIDVSMLDLDALPKLVA
jgi:type I restriction enzyme, S subunit